ATTQDITNVTSNSYWVTIIDANSNCTTLLDTVSVTGTNEKERFLIVKKNDGSVDLAISVLDSAGNPSSQYYHRLFHPSETKELRLYGLEGDDQFIVEGGPSKIKIRMVGGPGEDKFINHGEGKKLIAYDVNFENNIVEKGIRNRIKDDPQNNVYTRLGYNYKVVGVGPTAEISPIEGFFLGAKLKIITRGFRKDSFSIRNVISATHALSSSSVHLHYNGDFIRIAGHTDLLIRADMMVPTNETEFFGYGNSTLIDEAKNKKDYYDVSYDITNVSILLKHNLANWLSVSYGPSFQYLHLRTKENNSRFIGNYLDPTGTAKIYKPKYYGGAEAHIVADARNSTFMPTRGIVLDAYARVLKGMNSYSNDVTQTGGSITFYTDFISKGNVVLATIFGAGHNWGNFEFEQAQYLGFNDHLRGYRAQRFAGRSAAYNNTELRIKIADINAYLFPAAIGIYGFNDLGKVWVDREQAKSWHNGYGGGLWIAPLNRIVVTGYLSFSREEKALPWATIGFVF
ncbi:MAG: BamA/TamA family outer membrane protein, partial [Flavisolibacter sp.]